MAEIVSFTEFQDVYIMTHPTIKSRNQKAQTEWNQIKLKHLTKKQIKSKRLPSRQFPDGFHLEAKQLMSNWKRIYARNDMKSNDLDRIEQKKEHLRKQMIWTALEKQPIMDLPPLLMEQRYHNSSKYDVSLEQKNETMKMFKLKKSKRKPNKNAKKKAKKKKTKPKPKKTKPKPKTKTKKKKKKKHSDTESSSDDDEHILANVRLRKRAGTNTKKKKKDEKKHSDTESSSDDDISIHEWRRQQREAAKNKKKNTNTNNNDK
eukprot:563908_1